MAERQHQDPFLAAIEGKIAAWKAVADSYRAAVSLDGPLAESASTPGQPHKPALAIPSKTMDLPVGVFRDKSIREAIEILLTAGRRKQTNKEIATGLQKGGIATTSNFFEATVATALGRMKEDGVVLRFPDGWDLAASYPDSLRSRLEKDAKPQKRKPKKKAGKTPPANTDSDDKTAKILELISNHSEGVSISDIVKWFESRDVACSRDYVRVVTKRLRKRGLIRIERGMHYPPLPSL